MKSRIVIHEPSQSTLDKYALTLEEWWAFIPVDEDDNRVCPICETTPSSGRFVVDHQHVLGFKNRPPEERKQYVRGVVCTTDNHFLLTRYGTPKKHRNAAKYLERYERRLARWKDGR